MTLKVGHANQGNHGIINEYILGTWIPKHENNFDQIIIPCWSCWPMPKASRMKFEKISFHLEKNKSHKITLDN